MIWQRWGFRAAVVGRQVRAHHGGLDHLVRAGVRYQRVDGRRLAAAVTFYAFFAVFALGLLGFAVLGYVVDEPVVDRAVQSFLDDHLLRMDTDGLRAARGGAGLIALVSLPVIGLLWVDSLRSAVRAVWRVEEYPGRFIVRWLMDIRALAGLGLLLAASLSVAFGAEALLERLLGAAGGSEGAPSRWLLTATRFALGVAVNTLLSTAVLTLLPRLRMPLRRVLPPALLIAAGLELFTSLGRLIVARAETSPAFQLVAGAAGLLVFLLILNQLILFAAALTATATGGQVTDLATGQRLTPGPRPAPQPSAVDLEPATLPPGSERNFQTGVAADAAAADTAPLGGVDAGAPVRSGPLRTRHPQWRWSARSNAYDGAMRRTATTDAVIRLGQPLNLVLLPVLVWQASRLRSTMPRLPEAHGPRVGATPGQGPALHLAIMGDSSAAGVGAQQQEDALAGHVTSCVSEQIGRPVSWLLVARSGATARSVRRDLVPQLTGAQTSWKPDVVLVVVGGNDLTHYRPIPAWRCDMRALIEATRQRVGPVPVVLVGLPPFLRVPSLPEPLRTVSGLRALAMDDVLRRLARRTDDTWHVPSATLPIEGGDFFTTDGYHLATKGYRAWAEVISYAVTDAARRC